MGASLSHLLTKIAAAALRVFNLFRRRDSPMLDLPPEMIHSILDQVSANSFKDLCRVKKTCRALRDTINDDVYLRGVDLWLLNTPNRFYPGIENFKLRCLAAGNPSAHFLVGIHHFFREGDIGGLVSIRHAAETGYDLAIYSFACISRILNQAVVMEGTLLNPSREAVRAARSKVMSMDLDGWRQRLPPLFIEMANAIDVDAIYRCRCTRNRSWPRPWDERVKKGEMCTACFWRIHTLWFALEFKRKVQGWPQ